MSECDLHMLYLISYLGLCFIEGYRVVEIINNNIVLSLMEYQFSQDNSTHYARMSRRLISQYKIVHWEINDKEICENGQERRRIFAQITQVAQYFGEDVEINLLYIRSLTYSILRRVEIEAGTKPNCKSFYKRIDFIAERNGLRPMHEKEEGIALHRLVEIFLKEAGDGRNPETIRKLQGLNKLIYDLFKVLYTVCYILGKEILENGFQTISVEKWMHKTTVKKFKRLDLVLRNEECCCILDWKFSRVDAEEKIRAWA